MTSDDKKQKDKPKLVPHQNVQVPAGEKVKRSQAVVGNHQRANSERRDLGRGGERRENWSERERE